MALVSQPDGSTDRRLARRRWIVSSLAAWLVLTTVTGLILRWEWGRCDASLAWSHVPVTQGYYRVGSIDLPRRGLHLPGRPAPVRKWYRWHVLWLGYYIFEFRYRSDRAGDQDDWKWRIYPAGGWGH